MLKLDAQWRPGSFTKNFSWGDPKDGLVRLHEAIVVGFDGEIKNVTRKDFRSRIARLNRPDFIPLNFFLLNAVFDGESFVLVDELAYQALTRRHDGDFDALALLAFNNSYVGQWVGADQWQRYPAAWAYHYVIDRLAGQFQWDTASISADDIQRFVASDRRYTGATSRKLATNLAYMYRVGGLRQFSTAKVTRLWANAVFLCLDRLSAESGELTSEPVADDLVSKLERSKFEKLSGLESLDRALAVEALCKLYAACGGMQRWSVERVHERQQILIPHINQYLGSNEPWLVVDPLDATLAKAVPQACAMLARYVAGFEEIGGADSFDIEGFVKSRTQDAIGHIRALNISPRLSAEDLLRLTRD
jgi:hypothetical protein